MRTKEIQLLAILAVIAATIIALSMWSGSGGDGVERQAGETDPDEKITVASDSALDDAMQILSDLDSTSDRRRDESAREGRGDQDRSGDSGRDDFSTGRQDLFQSPPGASIDDEVVETEPEDIPLQSRTDPDDEDDEDEKTTESVTHTVERGETLSGISRQYYGTVGRWRDILEANEDKLPSPEGLRAGMSLVIPDAREVESSDEDSNQRETASLSTSADTGGEARTYTVQRGDTLWSIAYEHYGDGARHKALREANKDVIPSDNVLPAGVEIVIPE